VRVRKSAENTHQWQPIRFEGDRPSSLPGEDASQKRRQEVEVEAEVKVKGQEEESKPVSTTFTQRHTELLTLGAFS
jgi:hypothetical protein